VEGANFRDLAKDDEMAPRGRSHILSATINTVEYQKVAIIKLFDWF
jgi:hypothetical protein